MWLDPQNPVFQSGVAPFLTALLLVGAIFKLAGQPYGKNLAICGAAAAALVAYWLVFSLPTFPPRSASQKLGYLLALAGLLSVLFACRPGLAVTWRLVLFAVVLGGLTWIAEPKLKQGEYGLVFLIITGAAIALAGLVRTRDKHVEVGTTTLAATLAVTGIAISGASASIGQMALALAAATGGYLLWNWPSPRLEFAEAGTIAIGAPLIWLGGQAALYTKASNSALALGVAIAFAPAINKAVFGRFARQSDAVRPIITGSIAAVIAAFAVLIAYSGRPGQSGYAG